MPDRGYEPRPEKSSSSVAWIVGGVLLIAAGGVGLYWMYRPAPPPPITQATAPARPPVAQAPAAPEDAPPRYPIDTRAAANLPPLKDSDGLLQKSLSDLIGAKAVQDFVVTQMLARRAVVTIDNLAREKMAPELSPVKPVAGRFVTRGSGENMTISPDNARRYAPLIKVVQGLDAQKAVAAYTALYPLLQQSYQEIGYPKGYFNDRVVEVIDHLLETPDVTGPIKVTQPKVLVLYADPELEARSPGQKILLRMGRDNAAIVKAKLRELRAELTRSAAR